MPLMLTAGSENPSAAAVMTVSMPSPGRSVYVSCLSAPTAATVASGADMPLKTPPGSVKFACRA